MLLCERDAAESETLGRHRTDSRRRQAKERSTGGFLASSKNRLVDFTKRKLILVFFEEEVLFSSDDGVGVSLKLLSFPLTG
jgi:hypothetical protein